MLPITIFQEEFIVQSIATQQLKVQKRTGKIILFDQKRIEKAIQAAFREEGLSDPIESLVDEVVTKLLECSIHDSILPVERIQDVVELILMRQGYYNVARSYIRYRTEHALARKTKDSFNSLRQALKEACKGLEGTCSIDELEEQISRQLFEGISIEKIEELAILTAKGLIEKEPDYDTVATRLLLRKIYRISNGYSFTEYIEEGVQRGILDSKLTIYNLNKLETAIDYQRDFFFTYLGLQALSDRYLLFNCETPQFFWMRVAMGLALNEDQPDVRAIEFYDLISKLDYIPSTPTLFNSGTMHPQLSSCYLSTVKDDLESIFKVIGDNAKLSKWAGGLGNDWTPIRALNAHIEGTRGKSQGLIPFLKIVNDTAVAVNQGGKRKGAVCCYLETWHLDIEEFLDLRKNTGDERRRTHDMNTANWIPDLFMKRVVEDQPWTLFSPDEVPDLHDLYGKSFEERYLEYESMAKSGKIKLFKEISALQLWRKMLSRLFETGHPWITFKDTSNLRSMQPHAGVIHSSNLCTEILLNTSADETAVCNLGSINLVQHLQEGKLDEKKLKQTITTAIRMLDNVIDLNFYPTEEAKCSNQKHRPIGLGLMGFHDTLLELQIPYDSKMALEFADQSMELISYHAIRASSVLSEERGCYPSFPGSLWSRGMVPIDTLKEAIGSLDWDPMRQRVKEKGMRNSQILAIAPTATISLFAGVSQSIEPIYTYLFVKSNLSGETTSVHRKLVEELKSRSLWDQEMLDELKYHDGSIQENPRIGSELKKLFKTAFEIEPEWLIEAASRRQKWIDMGQSLNLYLSEPSGKKLDQMYRLAWQKGLKTTYYLRTRAATQVEKSTLDINRYGIQPKWMKNKSPSSTIQVNRSCSLDEGCESCQ